MSAEAVTGSITDPEFRKRRARHAAASRTDTDYFIKKLVDSAPPLTAEQRDRLALILATAREPAPPVNPAEARRAEVARIKAALAAITRWQPGESEKIEDLRRRLWFAKLAADLAQSIGAGPSLTAQEVTHLTKILSGKTS
jgi:hypothetical protein